MQNIIEELDSISNSERDRYKVTYLPLSDIIPYLNNVMQGQGKNTDIKDDDESFNKPWGKLDRQQKSNRIMQYIQHLKEKYNPSLSSINGLKTMLIAAIENRQITRKTDVIYCQDTAEILRIEGLKYDRNTGIFHFGNVPTIIKVKKNVSKPTFDRSVLMS